MTGSCKEHIDYLQRYITFFVSFLVVSSIYVSTLDFSFFFVYCLHGNIDFPVKYIIPNLIYFQLLKRGLEKAD